MDSRWLNDISFLVIQAAIEVHRTLGPGLLENVYRACMIYELRQRNLSVIEEQMVPICYKDVIIEGSYRLDLLVGDEVVLEIKSVETRGVSFLFRKKFSVILRVPVPPC